MSAAPPIRPARREDFAAIAALYAHHVRHGLASFEEAPPDERELARRWEAVLAERLPYLVAEADSRLLGYAYASSYRARSAYRFTVEDSVYVDPAVGRRGIGRALLARTIDAAAAAGRRQMIAVIGDAANAPSIGLHAALGFRATGTLVGVGFKFGRWVDSVLMQRALGPGESALP